MGLIRTNPRTVGRLSASCALGCEGGIPAFAKLAINDYNVCDDFLLQVKDLEHEGAKIDIVGCRMHLFNTNDCMRLALGETDISWIETPQTIQDRLQRQRKRRKRLMRQMGRGK